MVEPRSAEFMFLALEPDDALAAFVRGCKQRVDSLVGQQTYLDHPPHLTVYLAAFDNPDVLLDAVAALAREMPPPRTRVIGWHVFRDDALSGGHTLVCQLALDDIHALQDWQLAAVDRLAPLRDQAATQRRYASRAASLTPEQRQSIAQYGFPYVGSLWHPHVTIASIRPADWTAIEREFLNTPPKFDATCPRATVYRLENEHPSAMRSFDLSGPARDESGAESRSHPLKSRIVAALGHVAERFAWIESATVTGSFLRSAGLEGISDIDFVVIVDQLNAERFAALQDACREVLEPALSEANFALRINPTLGPLKFNDAQTAVLHLMLYSRRAHIDHVIQSPFTCFDWQRSACSFKRTLAEVYPVFSLQPRHFLSARRSVSDYLRDYRSGRVSYRELACSASDYEEVRRELPMDQRDRIEFAWHIVRFLMQNLLKLVSRSNDAPEGTDVRDRFLAVFPEHAAEISGLFDDLYARKKAQDFATMPIGLDDRLEQFVLAFERQFRHDFERDATRHVVFRHAPTAWNHGTDDERRFQGRTDVPIEPLADEQVARVVERLTSQLGGRRRSAAYVSPLSRCRDTFAHVARLCDLPEPARDERLFELNYGVCEGMTIAAARRQYADLFTAWRRGEDPPFPGGESTADVHRRAMAFVAERWATASGDSVTCTHNVVLRTLVGHALVVPPSEWHRLRIGHVEPFTFLMTKRHGLFADLEDAQYRSVFEAFATNRVEPAASVNKPQGARRSA